MSVVDSKIDACAISTMKAYVEIRESSQVYWCQKLNIRAISKEAECSSRHLGTRFETCHSQSHRPEEADKDKQAEKCWRKDEFIHLQKINDGGEQHGQEIDGGTVGETSCMSRVLCHYTSLSRACTNTRLCCPVPWQPNLS